MNIFSYDELKRKADREIARLVEAEKNLNQQAAIDHALNAAFTIYHLIQWGQKAGKLQITKSVHDFIEGTTNKSLKVLHNVVTCNKHVSVNKPAFIGTTDPRLEDNIEYMITEDGATMISEDGVSLVTEESSIKIYFGDLDALEVLESALLAYA